MHSCLICAWVRARNKGKCCKVRLGCKKPFAGGGRRSGAQDDGAEVVEGGIIAQQVGHVTGTGPGGMFHSIGGWG